MPSTLDTCGLERYRHGLRSEAEAAVTETTQAVKADAETNVAYATGNLHDHIEIRGEGLHQWVEDGEPYAFAQELGFTPEQLADRGMTDYTFTPYMRPAAENQRPRFRARLAARLRRLAR